MNIFWHDASSEIDFLNRISGYTCEVTKNDGEQFNIELVEAHSLPNGAVALVFRPWDDEADRVVDSGEPREISTEDIKELSIY